MLTGASDEAEVGFRPVRIQQKVSVRVRRQENEGDEVKLTEVPAGKAEGTRHNC